MCPSLYRVQTLAYLWDISVSHAISCITFNQSTSQTKPQHRFFGPVMPGDNTLAHCFTGYLHNTVPINYINSIFGLIANYNSMSKIWEKKTGKEQLGYCVYKKVRLREGEIPRLKYVILLSSSSLVVCCRKRSFYVAFSTWTLITLLTRATLCIARSLPSCTVRPSVQNTPVLCLNG